MDQSIFSILDEYLQKRIPELVRESLDKHLQLSLPENDLMNTQEAISFLKITRAALYGLTHRRIIPYSKVGKRNMFSKKALLEWITSKRNKTVDEIENEVFASGLLRNRRQK